MENELEPNRSYYSIIYDYIKQNKKYILYPILGFYLFGLITQISLLIHIEVIDIQFWVNYSEKHKDVAKLTKENWLIVNIIVYAIFSMALAKLIKKEKA